MDSKQQWILRNKDKRDRIAHLLTPMHYKGIDSDTEFAVVPKVSH